MVDGIFYQWLEYQAGMGCRAQARIDVPINLQPITQAQLLNCQVQLAQAQLIRHQRGRCISARLTRSNSARSSTARSASSGRDTIRLAMLLRVLNRKCGRIFERRSRAGPAIPVVLYQQLLLQVEITQHDAAQYRGHQQVAQQPPGFTGTLSKMGSRCQAATLLTAVTSSTYQEAAQAGQRQAETADDTPQAAQSAALSSTTHCTNREHNASTSQLKLGRPLALVRRPAPSARPATP